MKKIRVLIVEDSPVVRMLLQHILASDPRLEVAAAVESGEEALRVLHRVAPDVISMDIRLPGINGFEATQRIMAERPTPIVVVSASVEAEDLKITMNALRAGALAVVEKPVGTSHAEYEAMAGRLRTQLAIMSEVRVVRQRLHRKLDFPGSMLSAAPRPPRRATAGSGGYRILGIAASTGGPNALAQLLTGLGPEFPLPVLLVQHITASFLEGFVSWLDSVSPFQAVIAREGEVPVRGKVYLAPAGSHLRLTGACLTSDRGEPVSSQRPSGTVLLESIARSAGASGIGVVLTGMGDDGARGLLALREAGGHTLVEDQSTAVVYGMPAAAANVGAACEILPLPEIAPRLIEITAESARVNGRN
jgi:two-component system, chemotaxis family, protein-glutamate methylesterase/glutaminase